MRSATVDLLDTNLNTLLINFEERRTCRIIGLAAQEFLSKPSIEACIIVLFQLIAILPNAVHLFLDFNAIVLRRSRLNARRL